MREFCNLCLRKKKVPSTVSKEKSTTPVSKGRKSLPWFTTLGLLGLLSFIGASRSGLPDFEVQLHDTYIRFDAGTTVFLITLTILAVACLFLIVEVAADRYRIVALLVAIVNPLAGIFVMVAIYTLVKTRDVFSGLYPTMGFPWITIILVILTALLCLQVLIEVRALRKFFRLLPTL